MPGNTEKNTLPPLFLAKDARETRRLLALGADPNAVCGLGRTALCFARSPLQAEVLLRAGADIGGTSLTSPLHHVSDPQTMLFLISKGADVNKQNHFRETPLFRVKNRACAEILIEHGATIEVFDIFGMSPLHYVSSKDVADILWSLEKQKMSNDNIRCLDIMEHIRLRPGMYIANTGNGERMEDGIYSLFQEVFENALDELSSGYGSKIQVTLKNRTLQIRDFGRGIPLDALKTVLTEPFSSGKINQDIYQRPIGMHGLGLKVVAALSDFLNVRAIRSGKYREIRMSRGVVLSDKSGECRELNGCEVSFSPDSVIFSDFQLQPVLLEKLIRLYCCANPFLTVVFNDKEFHHFHGLMDSLINLIKFEKMVVDPIRLCCEDIECVLVQCDQQDAEWYSFVNGHRTVNGGIHVNAVRSALWGAAKVIMKGSSHMRPDDVFTSVTGIVSVRINEPMFEAQTKNRLGNVDRFAVWQRSIQEALLNYWYGNVDFCEPFFVQIDRNIERRERSDDAMKTIHDNKSKGTKDV